MAKTQKETELKPHIAYLKCMFGVGNDVQYSYQKVIAPTVHHMDYAILNMAMKYGLKDITSITQEEYESKTQVQP